MRGKGINNNKGIENWRWPRWTSSFLGQFSFSYLESDLSVRISRDHHYGISKPMPDEVILERIRRASGISENTKLKMEYMFRKRVSHKQKLPGDVR